MLFECQEFIFQKQLFSLSEGGVIMVYLQLRKFCLCVYTTPTTPLAKIKQVKQRPGIVPSISMHARRFSIAQLSLCYTWIQKLILHPFKRDDIISMLCDYNLLSLHFKITLIRVL